MYGVRNWAVVHRQNADLLSNQAYKQDVSFHHFTCTTGPIAATSNPAALLTTVATGGNLRPGAATCAIGDALVAGVTLGDVVNGSRLAGGASEEADAWPERNNRFNYQYFMLVGAEGFELACPFPKRDFISTNWTESPAGGT
jgi:hypothetical protein